MFGATKLIVIDPQIAHEAQTTFANKFDKHYRVRDEFKCLMGESILFMKSNSRQAQKKKVAAAVFMKEQMDQLLKRIIQITQEKIEGFKAEIA